MMMIYHIARYLAYADNLWTVLQVVKNNPLLNETNPDVAIDNVCIGAHRFNKHDLKSILLRQDVNQPLTSLSSAICCIIYLQKREKASKGEKYLWYRGVLPSFIT